MAVTDPLLSRIEEEYGKWAAESKVAMILHVWDPDQTIVVQEKKRRNGRVPGPGAGPPSPNSPLGGPPPPPPPSPGPLPDKEKDDRDKAEKEKTDKEKADRDKAEKEKADKADRDKAEKEKADKADRNKAEKEKVDKEKADRDKAEKEKADKDNTVDNERADRDKVEKEKADREKDEKEKAEKDKADKAKADKEKADKEAEGEDDLLKSAISKILGETDENEGEENEDEGDYSNTNDINNEDVNDITSLQQRLKHTADRQNLGGQDSNVLRQNLTSVAVTSRKYVEALRKQVSDVREAKGEERARSLVDNLKPIIEQLEEADATARNELEKLMNQNTTPTLPNKSDQAGLITEEIQSIQRSMKALQGFLETLTTIYVKEQQEKGAPINILDVAEKEQPENLYTTGSLHSKDITTIIERYVDSAYYEMYSNTYFDWRQHAVDANDSKWHTIEMSPIELRKSLETPILNVALLLTRQGAQFIKLFSNVHAFGLYSRQGSRAPLDMEHNTDWMMHFEASTDPEVRIIYKQGGTFSERILAFTESFVFYLVLVTGLMVSLQNLIQLWETTLEASSRQNGFSYATSQAILEAIEISLNLYYTFDADMTKVVENSRRYRSSSKKDETLPITEAIRIILGIIIDQTTCAYIEVKDFREKGLPPSGKKTMPLLGTFGIVYRQMFSWMKQASKQPFYLFASGEEWNEEFVRKNSHSLATILKSQDANDHLPQFRNPYLLEILEAETGQKTYTMNSEEVLNIKEELVDADRVILNVQYLQMQTIRGWMDLQMYIAQQRESVTESIALIEKIDKQLTFTFTKTGEFLSELMEIFTICHTISTKAEKDKDKSIPGIVEDMISNSTISVEHVLSIISAWTSAYPTLELADPNRNTIANEFKTLEGKISGFLKNWPVTFTTDKQFHFDTLDVYVNEFKVVLNKYWLKFSTFNWNRQVFSPYVFQHLTNLVGVMLGDLPSVTDKEAIVKWAKQKTDNPDGVTDKKALEIYAFQLAQWLSPNNGVNYYLPEKLHFLYPSLLKSFLDGILPLPLMKSIQNDFLKLYDALVNIWFKLARLYEKNEMIMFTGIAFGSPMPYPISPIQSSTSFLVRDLTNERFLREESNDKNLQYPSFLHKLYLWILTIESFSPLEIISSKKKATNNEYPLSPMARQKKGLSSETLPHRLAPKSKEKEKDEERPEEEEKEEEEEGKDFFSADEGEEEIEEDDLLKTPISEYTRQLSNTDAEENYEALGLNSEIFTTTSSASPQQLANSLLAAEDLYHSALQGTEKEEEDEEERIDKTVDNEVENNEIAQSNETYVIELIKLSEKKLPELEKQLTTFREFADSLLKITQEPNKAVTPEIVIEMINAENLNRTMIEVLRLLFSFIGPLREREKTSIRQNLSSVLQSVSFELVTVETNLRQLNNEFIELDQPQIQRTTATTSNTSSTSLASSSIENRPLEIALNRALGNSNAFKPAPYDPLPLITAVEDTTPLPALCRLLIVLLLKAISYVKSLVENPSPNDDESNQISGGSSGQSDGSKISAQKTVRVPSGVQDEQGNEIEIMYDQDELPPLMPNEEMSGSNDNNQPNTGQQSNSQTSNNSQPDADQQSIVKNPSTNITTLGDVTKALASESPSIDIPIKKRQFQIGNARRSPAKTPFTPGTTPFKPRSLSQKKVTSKPTYFQTVTRSSSKIARPKSSVQPTAGLNQITDSIKFTAPILKLNDPDFSKADITSLIKNIPVKQLATTVENSYPTSVVPALNGTPSKYTSIDALPDDQSDWIMTLKTYTIRLTKHIEVFSNINRLSSVLMGHLKTSSSMPARLVDIYKNLSTQTFNTLVITDESLESVRLDWLAGWPEEIFKTKQPPILQILADFFMLLRQKRFQQLIIKNTSLRAESKNFSEAVGAVLANLVNLPQNLLDIVSRISRILLPPREDRKSSNSNLKTFDETISQKVNEIVNNGFAEHLDQKQSITEQIRVLGEMMNEYAHLRTMIDPVFAAVADILHCFGKSVIVLEEEILQNFQNLPREGSSMEKDGIFAVYSGVGRSEFWINLQKDLSTNKDVEWITFIGEVFRSMEKVHMPISFISPSYPLGKEAMKYLRNNTEKRVRADYLQLYFGPVDKVVVFELFTHLHRDVFPYLQQMYKGRLDPSSIPNTFEETKQMPDQILYLGENLMTDAMDQLTLFAEAKDRTYSRSYFTFSANETASVTWQKLSNPMETDKNLLDSFLSLLDAKATMRQNYLDLLRHRLWLFFSSFDTEAETPDNYLDAVRQSDSYKAFSESQYGKGIESKMRNYITSLYRFWVQELMVKQTHGVEEDASFTTFVLEVLDENFMSLLQECQHKFLPFYPIYKQHKSDMRCMWEIISGCLHKYIVILFKYLLNEANSIDSVRFLAEYDSAYLLDERNGREVVNFCSKNTPSDARDVGFIDNVTNFFVDTLEDGILLARTYEKAVLAIGRFSSLSNMPLGVDHQFVLSAIQRLKTCVSFTATIATFGSIQFGTPVSPGTQNKAETIFGEVDNREGRKVKNLFQKPPTLYPEIQEEPILINPYLEQMPWRVRIVLEHVITISGKIQREMSNTKGDMVKEKAIAMVKEAEKEFVNRFVPKVLSPNLYKGEPPIVMTEVLSLDVDQMKNSDEDDEEEERGNETENTSGTQIQESTTSIKGTSPAEKIPQTPVNEGKTQTGDIHNKPNSTTERQHGSAIENQPILGDVLTQIPKTILLPSAGQVPLPAAIPVLQSGQTHAPSNPNPNPNPSSSSKTPKLNNSSPTKELREKAITKIDKQRSDVILHAMQEKTSAFLTANAQWMRGYSGEASHVRSNKVIRTPPEPMFPKNTIGIIKGSGLEQILPDYEDQMQFDATAFPLPATLLSLQRLASLIKFDGSLQKQFNEIVQSGTIGPDLRPHIENLILFIPWKEMLYCNFAIGGDDGDSTFRKSTIKLVSYVDENGAIKSPFTQSPYNNWKLLTNLTDKMVETFSKIYRANVALPHPFPNNVNDVFKFSTTFFNTFTLTQTSIHSSLSLDGITSVFGYEIDLAPGMGSANTELASNETFNTNSSLLTHYLFSKLDRVVPLGGRKRASGMDVPESNLLHLHCLHLLLTFIYKPALWIWLSSSAMYDPISFFKPEVQVPLQTYVNNVTTVDMLKQTTLGQFIVSLFSTSFSVNSITEELEVEEEEDVLDILSNACTEVATDIALIKNGNYAPLYIKYFNTLMNEFTYLEKANKTAMDDGTIARYDYLHIFFGRDESENTSGTIREVQISSNVEGMSKEYKTHLGPKPGRTGTSTTTATTTATATQKGVIKLGPEAFDSLWNS